MNYDQYLTPIVFGMARKMKYQIIEGWGRKKKKGPINTF